MKVLLHCLQMCRCESEFGVSKRLRLQVMDALTDLEERCNNCLLSSGFQNEYELVVLSISAMTEQSNESLKSTSVWQLNSFLRSWLSISLKKVRTNLEKLSIYMIVCMLVEWAHIIHVSRIEYFSYSLIAASQQL